MIRLMHGDCLELMKKIPDKSVDMILTDPPYLMNYKTGHRKNKEHEFCSEIENDDFQLNKDVVPYFLKQSHRIMKENSGIYCFCNSNKVDFFKSEIEKHFAIKNIICWVKNNWTAGDLKGAFGKQYEFIIYANRGRRILNGKRFTDVWFFDRVVGKAQIHQNQEPVDLLEQAIKASSNEGETVLDCFMGSGSTGVACINTNRNFIGIEKDDKYFEIAKNRIKEASNEKRA